MISRLRMDMSRRSRAAMNLEVHAATFHACAASVMDSDDSL